MVREIVWSDPATGRTSDGFEVRRWRGANTGSILVKVTPPRGLGRKVVMVSESLEAGEAAAIGYINDCRTVRAA